MSSHYTARFQAYARTKGLPPARCPAGAGFITWITARLREWRQLTSTNRPMNQQQHDDFDSWLTKKTGGTK